MKVLVINNDGGGFADYVDVPEGTTVREMFERTVKSSSPHNYLIRVNRQPVPQDQTLREVGSLLTLEADVAVWKKESATNSGWRTRSAPHCVKQAMSDRCRRFRILRGTSC